MRKTVISAIFLVLAAALMAEKPNVVFILSDDQAWTDYGFMGHTHIETPHLDRLADQSVVFPQGYYLYHLKEDPHETEDLSYRYPEKVERLKEKILEWYPYDVESRILPH